MSEAMQLVDNHGREISYLRISVTDRCNLRCSYCMPEEGINFVNKDELLTYEEMLRISGILVNHGIKKIRITGGEPFVRTDIMGFLERLVAINGLETVSITTNGVLLKKHIHDLKNLGIQNINLSLDTFNPETFKKITRRDDFSKVRDSLFALIENGFNVKVNAVVMEGLNESDIIPLSRLSINLPVKMRFIEEMPFNGQFREAKKLTWNSQKILNEIQTVFPSIEKFYTNKTSTSENYKIPGAKGLIGLIAAYTRTFCGSCNRIRINATGGFRTCLYGKEELDMKSLVRSNKTDEQIIKEIKKVINRRSADGFEAEKLNQSDSKYNESMTNIGG